MKKNLLSITKLARIRNLTSETLRYYSRIGLLEPDYVDPSNNYRYYSILQYEKLGTIKELRQLGISIDDIVDYFKNRNLKKSISILEKQQQALQKEIAEKTHLESILNKKINFLHELTSPPMTNTVFERVFPERNAISFQRPAGGSLEHALEIAKLESHLEETAPVLASDRIGVYADVSILEPSEHHHPSLPFILGEKNAIPTDLRISIPSGPYLCMYYKGGTLEKYHETFEIIKNYMKTMNMHVNGKILQIYKVDVTVTSDPTELLMEIQVPVRKMT